MGKVVLVTGGARSGKSDFSESLLKEKKTVCYLATNSANVDDPENHHRILLHQQKRPHSWHTEEGYWQVADYLAQATEFDGYLLDCATLLTLNCFYQMMTEQHGQDYAKIDKIIQTLTEEEKQGIEMRLLKEWQEILKVVRRDIAGDFVIVTNEVGLGIVPENSFTRWFRDIYGRMNQYLGKEADEVYLVVASIPVKIK